MNRASLQTAPDRLEREREFHNQRYADDQARQKRVGRFYEIAAPFYAKYQTRILSHARGAEVLEYGVGPGSDAFALAEQGARVTGIDISDTAVAIARREAERRGLQIDFQVNNAEATGFDNESFDLICGNGILHHLDLQKAIAEIYRLLRPGGGAVFVEPMGHNPFINLFRRMTPAIRSTDEHPLLHRDLQFIESQFKVYRAEFFALLSLSLSFAGPLRRNSSLRRVFAALDSCLFTVPVLRRQAWLVLMELAR